SPDYYEIKVNGRSNYILLTEEDEDTGDEPEEGHTGTAQAGATSTITLEDTALPTVDAYNGMVIEITDGKGKGQKRIITAYNDSQVATVDLDWTEIPNTTSEYSLYWILSGANDSLVHTDTAQAGGVNTITLAAEASDEDDFYNNMTIVITEGTGSGQTFTIDDYDGSTQVATVDGNWVPEPENDSVYQVTEPTTLDPVDYTRTDSEQGNRKGLSGFTEIDEISIVYSPNSRNINGLSGALITHCETLKDRFAIIDAEQGEDASTLNPRSDRVTQYAAFYYPWIYIVDPQTGSLRVIPPGGYMAGIYARSDTERGVHKAPANEVVRGAKKLEFLITKGEHDLLNPRGVNVIRSFPGRGIRVWGARTLSSNTLWKYINVRRLFIFVEESIEEGTQWVVFEPNNEKLWARVRATITQFLTRVWRDGALMGIKAEEAFFVKCDRSTMTQDDIDNGRLICVIGIAPVKPAEFVIFRIAQWAGGSAVTE
ncbi:MAG: phage tail sheath family protein, partial [Candidatus Aegiribacteria sp.]|nr:phage tail sheath family protein [Candidatus Aegiribacteria sp.]